MSTPRNVTIPPSTRSSLLERVKSKDADAWRRLVDLYGPLVFHWCRRQNLPPEDVADVFQEVFRAVAIHIVHFRKERPSDSFRGWLLVITQNKIRDHYRRLGKGPVAVGGSDACRQLDQVPAPASSSDAGEMDQQHQLLHRGLDLIRAEFEERTWEAFWGVVVEGRTPAEMADALGITANAVYKSKARVLRRLREELGDLTE
jgi:RNA polymerase sigma-70 factor (ECF subfamily)